MGQEVANFFVREARRNRHAVVRRRRRAPSLRLPRPAV